MAQHVVANPNGKQEFTIPVTWQVFSQIEVQADSLEEAYNWAKENIDEIPLDSDWDYVDGSYALTADSPEECEMYNE